ncbi:hypothetical protein DRW07_15985 [Alteromonas sediminis]|uniref:Uncharacterized protein n=1 Tax=Alteromonas sediminis TaxID=2259342 RepID=A0A3N5YKG0_9ALTE|nr:hypothetical protein [Alteromonas sediminis]RPJ65401.1 hypothetical protein DRW07_15985 [Alteromonas sediminis]
MAVGSIIKKARYLAVLGASLVLLSCAKTSPRFEQAISLAQDGRSGNDIFTATYAQHGGERVANLHDLNVAIDGEWHYLITKIQPEVTDSEYRQRSEERLVLSPRLYAVRYSGTAGSKQVLRTTESIQVSYNDARETSDITLGAAALTSDAFFLFSLGPLALANRVSEWQRLADETSKGRHYYRINGEMVPGIGLSKSDYITLWVDKETKLTHRLHITLDGFEKTKGAHVDTHYLHFHDIDGLVLPTHFFERVVGPISIDAHEWWYTGFDVNRGLTQDDLSIEGWSEKALVPATPFQGKHD